MGEHLLEVEDLKQYFKVSKQFTVKAVDGVSFYIDQGETYGLVGESGSGKSTIGRSIIRLYEPTGGRVTFEGVDISGPLGPDAARHLRTRMQMIFQDPMACLNPRKKVGDIIAQGLDIHRLCASRQERQEKVYRIMERMGLAREHANRYPHQFSGGQRQRIGIARALVMEPKLVIADEPISALDVSIQAQVLNLLHRLQEEYKLTYVFISHDLSVVEMISDRIAVMYLGFVVETAPKEKLYARPAHPYTEALLSAVPIPDPTLQKERIILEGDIPSTIDLPAGCPFAARCKRYTKACLERRPETKEIEPGHFVACHLY